MFASRVTGQRKERRVEETTQSVKYLSLKYEGVSLDTLYLHTNLAVAAHTIPALKGYR